MNVAQAFWIFLTLGILGVVGLITYSLLDAARWGGPEERDEHEQGGI